MRRFLVTLLVIAGVVAAGGWFWLHRARAAASQDLDRALARHTAQGLVVRWEDLAAGIPWPTAECAAARYDVMKRVRLPSAPRWGVVDGGPSDPLEDPAWRASADAWVAAVDPWCRELAELQRRCPGPLTGAGLNLPPAPGEDLAEYGRGVKIPNLLGARAFAEWAALHAFHATAVADRSAAHDDLDRLVASLRPSLTLIDAMIEIATESLRDEAYAALAHHGLLDPDRLASWVQERSRAHEVAADGLRGERLLVVLPLLRALVEGRAVPAQYGDVPWSWDPASIWRDHVSRPWVALQCGEEVLEAHAAMERWLRTGEGSEAAASASTRIWDPVWPFDRVVPNHLEIVAAAADRDQRHRSLRIAALLAEEARRGAPLPRSDAEARARLGSRASWMDGNPRGYGLVYERLTDAAFRVVVDRASPLLAVFPTIGEAVCSLEPRAAPPLGSKTPEQLVADPRWSPAWGTRVVLRRP